MYRHAKGNKAVALGQKEATMSLTKSLAGVVRHGTRAKEKPSPKFRADVQGLRAVAVGAVILDHAAIPGFTGGFTGVDVFFVISGFLITSLLLGDIAKYSKVRFLTFYARRAARILPAASVVLVATALASVAILGVLGARSELGDSVWAIFFAANFHFASVGTNYFATSTATSPIQHYWSLAVEEQFYLVWPALIGAVAWLFHRRKQAGYVPRAQLGVVLAIVTGVSLYFSVIQTASNPTGAYFSTLDRVWELAIGALLATVLPLLAKIPGVVRAILSWTGLGGIVVAATLYNASTSIPGWKALLPVLASGAVLVGGIGAAKGGAHLLLSLRPFRFIGDISYSLYLWHFPILILGAAYLGRRDTLDVRFGLIGAAIVVSALSYYGLENPLRHAKILLHRSWHSLLLWPVAVGMVLGVSFLAAPSVPFAAATTVATQVPVTQAVAQAVAAGTSNAPIPLTTTPSLIAAPNDHVNLGACDAYNTPNWHLCNYGDPTGTQTVVIFGNSHGAMWVPAIAAAAKASHMKFYPVVHEACGFQVMVDIGNKWGPDNICTKWYDVALADIAKLRPSTIIFGTYTGEAGWIPGEKIILNKLKTMTPRVIVLSDTTAIGNPAACMLQSNATQGTCLASVTATRASNTTITQQLAAASGSQFVNVTPWFCDDNRCPSLINDIVPFFDGAHLTAAYSSYLGTAMGEALNLEGKNVVEPQSVAVTSVTTTTAVVAGS